MCNKYVVVGVFYSKYCVISHYIVHVCCTTGLSCVANITRSINDNNNNDCDWLVDEELADGIDNDRDGLIDEDLAANILYPILELASSSENPYTVIQKYIEVSCDVGFHEF